VAGFVAGSLWAAAAGASGTRAAVVVLVEGPSSDAVAGWIEDRLSEPDTIEQQETFRGALRARGVLPLHAAVGNAARDVRLIACAHAAAGQADVDGAILVDLQKSPSGTHAHVWNVDLRRGGAVIESDVALPAAASVADEARGILTVIPAAPPPPPPPPVASPARSVEPTRIAPPPIAKAPAPDATPAADAVAKQPRERNDDRFLDLQAAVGVGTRHFSYVDRVTPSLRPYDLPAAPLASVTATVYPFALSRTPVLRDIGVTGDFAQAFAVSSEDSTGAHVGTTWQSFDVGAIARIPVTRAFGASVSLGYGGNDFKFDQALAGGAAQLPSVAYRFLRAGGDVRVAFLGRFSAFAGGSYMDMLSTGYTAALFPRESVGGVEAHLGASLRLAKSWEVSLAASYTRVFYSVNPVPGDASVAGGALDQQGRLLAGLSYVM
jgi:hypothetical protein